MAALSTVARNKIAKGLMRWWSARNIEYSNILKDDIYDSGANTGAVADADDWLDANDGGSSSGEGFNVALSDPFKSNATSEMKGDLMLITLTVRVRNGAGYPDIYEYARRIVMEDLD